MMTLYDNAFSPFARKVRLVLDVKGLAHEALDGLDLDNHDRLARGYHEWFMGEIEAGRVLWPGLGVPAPEGAR